MPFLLETSKQNNYRLTAPDGTVGDIFDYGEQAHVVTRDGECWALFVNTAGETDGHAYHIPEPGSLAILEAPQTVTVDEQCEEFIFE